MPMLAELQQRYPSESRGVSEPTPLQELIISDTRSGLNSKEMLEAKFGKALLREESRGDQAQGVRPRPR